MYTGRGGIKKELEKLRYHVTTEIHIRLIQKTYNSGNHSTGKERREGSDGCGENVRGEKEVGGGADVATNRR